MNDAVQCTVGPFYHKSFDLSSADTPNGPVGWFNNRIPAPGSEVDGSPSFSACLPALGVFHVWIFFCEVPVQVFCQLFHWVVSFTLNFYVF